MCLYHSALKISDLQKVKVSFIRKSVHKTPKQIKKGSQNNAQKSARRKIRSVLGLMCFGEH